MSVLAIIPARAGSKGIPGKNFRLLAGISPLERAYLSASAVTPDTVISTDATNADVCRAWRGTFAPSTQWLARPPELAHDDTPMIAVVQHVLEHVPGPDDQIIVLLQPTQPLRKPEHVRAAIALVASGTQTRVSSVTPAESPDKLLRFNDDGLLVPWGDRCVERRQDSRPAYRRDGTVYAWRRDETDPFGLPAVPLVIPPEETCALDTEAEWAEAERRLVLCGDPERMRMYFGRIT